MYGCFTCCHCLTIRLFDTFFFNVMCLFIFYTLCMLQVLVILVRTTCRTPNGPWNLVLSTYCSFVLLNRFCMYFGLQYTTKPLYFRFQPDSFLDNFLLVLTFYYTFVSQLMFSLHFWFNRWLAPFYFAWFSMVKMLYIQCFPTMCYIPGVCVPG